MVDIEGKIYAIAAAEAVGTEDMEQRRQVSLVASASFAKLNGHFSVQICCLENSIEQLKMENGRIKQENMLGIQWIKRNNTCTVNSLH